MKTLFSILMVLALAFDASAQKSLREATAAEVTAGTAGLPAVLTPRRAAGLGGGNTNALTAAQQNVVTNVTVLTNSPTITLTPIRTNTASGIRTVTYQMTVVGGILTSAQSNILALAITNLVNATGTLPLASLPDSVVTNSSTTPSSVIKIQKGLTYSQTTSNNIIITGQGGSTVLINSNSVTMTDSGAANRILFNQAVTALQSPDASTYLAVSNSGFYFSGGTISGSGASLTAIPSTGLALTYTNSPNTNNGAIWVKEILSDGRSAWHLSITNQP